MNEKIKNHILKYCKKNEYDFPNENEEWWEFLTEESEIFREKIDDKRWWTQTFCVVEIEGMLIGYSGASTTGDSNASEKGWEFDYSSICEIERKVEIKEVVTYLPIK